MCDFTVLRSVPQSHVTIDLLGTVLGKPKLAETRCQLVASTLLFDTVGIFFEKIHLEQVTTTIQGRFKT